MPRSTTLLSISKVPACNRRRRGRCNALLSRDRLPTRRAQNKVPTAATTRKHATIRGYCGGAQQAFTEVLKTLQDSACEGSTARRWHLPGAESPRPLEGSETHDRFARQRGGLQWRMKLPTWTVQALHRWPPSLRGALRNVRNSFSAVPARCQRARAAGAVLQASFHPVMTSAQHQRRRSCRASHSQNRQALANTPWCMSKQRGRTGMHHTPRTIHIKCDRDFRPCHDLDNFSHFFVVFLMREYGTSRHPFSRLPMDELRLHHRRRSHGQDAGARSRQRGPPGKQLPLDERRVPSGCDPRAWYWCRPRHRKLHWG